MNKIKIKNLLLLIVVSFSILSIIRSIGMFILHISNPNITDLDFEEFLKIRDFYIWVFYYIPYIIMIPVIIFVKRFYRSSNWVYYAFFSFIGLLLFFFLDEIYIRPLFILFSNQTLNLFIHGIFFISIIFTILLFTSDFNEKNAK